MEYQTLIQTLETRSAEIKGAQTELAERVLGLERQAANSKGFNATTEASGFEVKSVLESLANSGNFTAKSNVPASVKSILVNSNTSLLPTVGNLGVIGQSEISLSAQLPSFAIQEAIVRFTRLSTNDSAAIQGGEGNLKKELAIDSTPVERESNTFAAWVAVSTQALADQKGITEAINSVLTVGIRRAVDAHAFSVAQAEGTAAVTGASPLVTVLGAIANVQAQGYAAVAYLNPADFVAVQLSQSTTGEFLDLPSAFVGTIRPAAGIPVGQFLVNATSGEGLSLAIRENLSIDIGVQNDQFVRNLRSVLIETRGLGVIKNPALVLTGALAKATK